MTDSEIDRLIWQIQEMARRIGCDFIPDAAKLKAFKKSQAMARESYAQYRAALAC
jgi:hypothetical protein